MGGKLLIIQRASYIIKRYTQSLRGHMKCMKGTIFLTIIDSICAALTPINHHDKDNQQQIWTATADNSNPQKTTSYIEPMSTISAKHLKKHLSKWKSTTAGEQSADTLPLRARTHTHARTDTHAEPLTHFGPTLTGGSAVLSPGPPVRPAPCEAPCELCVFSRSAWGR